jgi:Outer membrane protein beta-barrel domain
MTWCRKAIFLLCLLPLASLAQRLHLHVAGGIANYQGDLQPKRIDFEQIGGVFGAGMGYELTDKWMVKAMFSVSKLQAYDKLATSKSIASRNLNFQTYLQELSLTAEYALLNPYEHRLSPYLFTGVAAFHFRPFTIDASNRIVYLQPLSTEGQGLPEYPDRSPYKLTQIAIPFGGGFRFIFNEKIGINAEIGMRKLFTDYLDDVSTTYVDQLTLLNRKGPNAVALAYRGDELPGGLPYPADGTPRGSAKSKDWYYFGTIGISYRLGAGDGMGGNRKSYRNKVGCPRVF